MTKKGLTRTARRTPYFQRPHLGAHQHFTRHPLRLALSPLLSLKLVILTWSLHGLNTYVDDGDGAIFARVTQLPSWVKKPSLYQPHSSSLVVSFEDPDGTSLSSLLAARHLFGFGAQLTVRKWRQPPPSQSKREAMAARRKRQQKTKAEAERQWPPGPGRSAEPSPRGDRSESFRRR
jgi:hypothetical protein